MAGRGGLQQPKNPAPVSNPQSGARTDGGAGSKGQPVRVPTGGKYGEAKASAEQQGAAPMAAGGGGTVPAGGTGGGGQPPPVEGGVFGPTEQPNVNPGAGGDQNSPRQMAAQNPDQFLRVLYAQYPTAAIGALMRRGGTNA